MIDDAALEEVRLAREAFAPNLSDFSRELLSKIDPRTEHGKVAVKAHLLALDLFNQDATGETTEALASARVEYVRVARACIDKWRERESRRA